VAVTITDDIADERLANWLDRYRHGDLALSVEVGSPSAAFPADGAMPLAFGISGGEAPIAELKSAGKVFPLGVKVSTPGEGSLIGGVPLRDQARWVGLFGVLGLALLAGVAAIAAAGESCGTAGRWPR
jgi:hypothetical protein